MGFHKSFSCRIYLSIKYVLPVLFFSLLLFGSSQIHAQNSEFRGNTAITNADVDEQMDKLSDLMRLFREGPETQPMPMPVPIQEKRAETSGVDSVDNRVIYYNSITREETVLDAPKMRSTATSDSVKGSAVTGVSFSDIASYTLEDDCNWDPVPNFDYPWSASCKIIIAFEDSSGDLYLYEAVGVFIDPMHVLTAGHNVYDHANGYGWALAIFVIPAYNEGDDPYGYAAAVEFYAHSGWRAEYNFEYDIAVIKLIDENIGDECPRALGSVTGWHGYAYNNDDGFFTSNSFFIVGYPYDPDQADPPQNYDVEHLLYLYRPMDIVFTEVMQYLCPGMPGTSGSGVYYLSDENVYGVVSAGNSSVTQCCRITKSKFDEIKDFISGNTPSSFDLWALNSRAGSSEIDAGERLPSFDFLAHNYSSVSKTGTFTAKVYLSTDDRISSADTLIKTGSFTHNFSPKDSFRVTWSGQDAPQIPGDTAEGEYYLGVILDLNDYDKTNNDSSCQDAFSIYVHEDTCDKPTLTSFSINNGAAATCSRTVTLNNTATNSPTHYMASEDPGFSGATWKTYAASPSFTLSSGKGTKTVYLKLKNDCGESNTRSDDIQLNEAPHLTSFAINNGAAVTCSRTVTLDIIATNDPTHYMASEDSGFSGATWKTYSDSPPFTLSPGCGIKTVYIKVKNECGESNVMSDSILLKETPTITTFAINNGAATTGNLEVTLNNTATCSPTHYRASENPDFSGAVWNLYSASPPFTLSSGEGLKTVYFQVKNECSESGTEHDSIEYKESDSLTLRLPEVCADPGDQIAIPIEASDTTQYEVTDALIKIAYDPSILTAISVTTSGTLTESWLADSGVVPGQITIALASGSPLIGSGVLIYVNFSVLPDAPIGSTSDLIFVEAELNEGEVLPIHENGMFTVGCGECGDVSLNGEVTPHDASLILQYSVGKIIFTPGQLALGDVSCNGEVTPHDASTILKYIVGKVPELVCGSSCPVSMIPYTSVSSSAEVGIPEVRGYAGGSIAVPINISGVAGLGITDALIKVTYDSAILTATGITTAGTLTESWLADSGIDPGQIIIALASDTALSSDGILVYIDFDVASDAEIGSMSDLTLTEVKFNEGEVCANKTDGTFTVDGQIEIPLAENWNLVSFPLQPVNTDPDVVLSSIAGKYDSVWAYDSVGGWSIHAPGGASDLDKLESGKGYWLKMYESATLVIQGTILDSTAIFLMGNEWNLAGYSSMEPRSAEECMSSVASDIDSVWEYGPHDAVVKSWSIYAPEGASDLENMKPGYGYWIKAILNCVWDISLTDSE